jgi:clan AA aspartic protease
MGKIMTKVKLTNNTDRDNVDRGLTAPEGVRSIVVEALVDTGATMMTIPRDVAEALGLPYRGYRNVRYADGRTARIPWVGSLLIEILGREMVCDALVEAVGSTPLIGQIPLEGLDLLVDPKTREARVNPASPDLPMLDLLHVA